MQKITEQDLNYQFRILEESWLREFMVKIYDRAIEYGRIFQEEFSEMDEYDTSDWTVYNPFIYEKGFVFPYYDAMGDEDEFKVTWEELEMSKEDYRQKLKTGRDDYYESLNHPVSIRIMLKSENKE